MGEESLYEQFINERIDDLVTAMTTIGIYGILKEFEIWLYNKELIKNTD